MTRRVVALGLLVLAAGGCRFERRAEVEADAAEPAPATEADEARPEAPADELLRSFQDLRRAGAVEEARELLHPRAQLVDRGARYVTGAPSSALRPLLGPGPSLGTWTVPAVDTLAGDGPRLYVLAYGPTAGAEAEGGSAAVESILLVPTPRGWRVRLLHRSAVT